MHHTFVYAVNAQCANPNNNSGPCGAPGSATEIIIIACLAAVVVLYVAFWAWLPAGNRQVPHTHLGRLIGRALGAATVGIGSVTRKRPR